MVIITENWNNNIYTDAARHNLCTMKSSIIKPMNDQEFHCKLFATSRRFLPISRNTSKLFWAIANKYFQLEFSIKYCYLRLLLLFQWAYEWRWSHWQHSSNQKRQCSLSRCDQWRINTWISTKSKGERLVGENKSKSLDPLCL